MRLAMVALAVQLLLGGAVLAAEPAPDPAEARFHSLISELRCLVCQNQSIAESNAPLAADLREQVRLQIAKGRSDAEIAEFLTDRYGDFVLYRPPFRPRTWLLWLGPFCGLLLAAGAAVLYIRRTNARSAPAAEEAGSAPEIARVGLPLRIYAAALAAVLVFAGLWYVAAGSWRTQALVDLADSDPAAAQSASMDAMLARLQQRVREQPDDAEAWAWIGRGEMRREAYVEAAQAYAQANRLTGGQDPDLLVEEGEALAQVHGGSLAGAPSERFAAALAIAPDHSRGLWYAGLAALHHGDNAAAAGHWERLLAQDVPDDLRRVLSGKVAELRGGTAPAAATAAPARTAVAGLELQIDVSVAPELQSQIAAGSTLLVYALEPGGPRMPLAVHRQAAGPGPWKITLDDSKSMLPGRKLSSVARWRVLARITASGNAQPQPGDLQGELELEAGAAAGRHALRINQRME